MNSDKSSIRKIIHLDMDAFYASVEQRDFAHLRGQPVAVGWEAKRSVVCAASYEARKFGVRSAMPAKIARKKCPQLIFVKPRFDAYKKVSLQIQDIFHRYTDLVEPLSLDEAYLDVTESKSSLDSATAIAQQIKQDIWTETALTASAGVSYCKFLAKIASDINKPNGIFVIKPHEAQNFIAQLPIGKFYGIGQKTATQLNSMGIFKGQDLLQRSKEELESRFGKSGTFFYNMVRGIDHRAVVNHRVAKSIGSESTFDEDTQDVEVLKQKLAGITEDLLYDVERKQIKAKTLTLKIKYHDFVQNTRSKTLPKTISPQHVLSCGIDLLMQSPLLKPVRLLGLQLSNFQDEASLNPSEAFQLSFDF